MFYVVQSFLDLCTFFRTPIGVGRLARGPSLDGWGNCTSPRGRIEPFAVAVGSAPPTVQIRNSAIRLSGRLTTESVLPAGVPRLAVEAGCSIGWDRYVGRRGATVTIDRFGASAPLADLQREYGLEVDQVVDRARQLL